MAPCLPEVVELLGAGELHPHGYVTRASNHTLLVTVGDPDGELLAIYKPRAGERPLWDFPAGTLCCREVAAYEVSEALGWQIVPPTVLRDGPAGQGSVQLFVDHDPSEHYFNFVTDARHERALARLATFDLLVNNADRKGSHVLRARDDGRLVGIDHGLTFHTEPKLRTVIWDLGEAPIEEEWRADLARVLRDLDGGNLAQRLETLLSPEECEALAVRASALAERDRLPALPTDRRPYPWPPL